jgi:hypothetical protein
MIGLKWEIFSSRLDYNDHKIMRRMTMFYRLFKEHPEAVQETYVQHAIFASRFALKLAAAAGAALVHAVVPALFEKTASRIVADLYAKTHNRGN